MLAILSISPPRKNKSGKFVILSKRLDYPGTVSIMKELDSMAVPKGTRRASYYTRVDPLWAVVRDGSGRE
jgi:hypothetical protein